MYFHNSFAATVKTSLFSQSLILLLSSRYCAFQQIYSLQLWGSRPLAANLAKKASKKVLDKPHMTYTESRLWAGVEYVVGASELATIRPFGLNGNSTMQRSFLVALALHVQILRSDFIFFQLSFSRFPLRLTTVPYRSLESKPL